MGVIMQKVDYKEIDTVIDTFLELSYEKYKSYGYATGYLATMLKRAIDSMPSKEQREMLDFIKIAP